MLSGKMTVQEDGAESQDIGPGDLAVFPKGWKGVWNVTERLSLSLSLSLCVERNDRSIADARPRLVARHFEHDNV